jgi:hypothetical protein
LRPAYAFTFNYLSFKQLKDHPQACTWLCYGPRSRPCSRSVTVVLEGSPSEAQLITMSDLLVDGQRFVAAPFMPYVSGTPAPGCDQILTLHGLRLTLQSANVPLSFAQWLAHLEGRDAVGDD